MKRQNVLVCGGTGFIGRHITEALKLSDHYQVYATYYRSPPLSISNIIPVYADLTSQEDVDRVIKDMDIVVQAAAVTTGSKDVIERPYIHVTDNAVMNSLILRSCYENNVSHYIFFSCSVMYQTKNAHFTRRYVSEADFDPSAEIFPNYHGVAWTKVYIEKMCEFYSNLGRTKHTVVRHSNIYGPFDKFDLDKSHVLGATITKFMKNRDNRILVWGTGEEERDFLYISDLVEFVTGVLVKQLEQFQIFNVGSGEVISVGDLNRLVMKITGCNYEITFDKTKPTIPTKLGLNCNKAYEALQWEPKVSLTKGLEHTLEWYREYGDDSATELVNPLPLVSS